MEGIEIGWAAVTYAGIIAEMFVMGYALHRFAKPFMANKKGAYWIGIAYAASLFILYFMPLMISNFTAYSIGVLSAFIVMCRIDCRNYKQKIFLAATFFSLRWLSGYMTVMVEEILHQQMIDTAYMTRHPVIQLAAYGGLCVLGIVARFAIIGLSTGYIVRTYVYKRENMSIKEMFMLITPSITGMTAYGIMQYYQTLLEMSPAQAISGIYIVLALLYFSISIITIVVVSVLFQNIKARQEEKLQNELLAMQVSDTEKHIEQIENLYQNIRGIRHDMINHILTLERLYAGNNAAEAADYGRELKSALSGIAGEIKSGNPVTDIVLQEWKKEAEQKGICFQSDFYYPAGTDINAFDVSVILNNALQNAVENAKSSDAPHISVLSYHRNNAYMIEISNSFTGTLKWDEERGLPVTSKQRAEGHGYGLSNIRMVARKYSGDIAIDIKEQVFCLSVMLIMKS